MVLSRTVDHSITTRRSTQRTLKPPNTQRTSPDEHRTTHNGPETTVRTPTTRHPPQTTDVRTSERLIHSTDGPTTHIRPTTRHPRPTTNLRTSGRLIHSTDRPTTHISPKASTTPTTFSTAHSNTTTAAVATHHYNTDPTAAEIHKIGVEAKGGFIIGGCVLAILLVAIACFGAWYCWLSSRPDSRKNATKGIQRGYTDMESMRSSTKCGSEPEKVRDQSMKVVPSGNDFGMETGIGGRPYEQHVGRGTPIPAPVASRKNTSMLSARPDPYRY